MWFEECANIVHLITCVYIMVDRYIHCGRRCMCMYILVGMGVGGWLVCIYIHAPMQTCQFLNK